MAHIATIIAISEKPDDTNLHIIAISWRNDAEVMCQFHRRKSVSRRN